MRRAERTAEQVHIDITEKETEIIYLSPVEPLEGETYLSAVERLDDDIELDHHQSTQGEHLRVDERLVLAPASGRFWMGTDEPAPEKGEFIVRGQFIGHVVGPNGKPAAVRSPFSGWAMGFLIPNGSPVKNAEPVLWLRTS